MKDIVMYLVQICECIGNIKIIIISRVNIFIYILVVTMTLFNKSAIKYSGKILMKFHIKGTMYLDQLLFLFTSHF